MHDHPPERGRRAQTDPAIPVEQRGWIGGIQLAEVECASGLPIHLQDFVLELALGAADRPGRHRPWVEPVTGVTQHTHILDDRGHAIEPRAHGRGAIVLVWGEVAGPRCQQSSRRRSVAQRQQLATESAI